MAEAPAPADPDVVTPLAAPTSWRIDRFGGGWTGLAGASLSIYRCAADCEAVWRASVAECACYAFQNFEWLATWQATIGESRHVTPHFVHLEDSGGRPLLFLALATYPHGALRVLSFLGGMATDYNAPVMAPRFVEEVAAAEFARLWRVIIDLLPAVDVVWLHRIPETIDGVRNPMTALPGARHTENAYAARLPESLAEFRAARTTHIFSDNRRQRRRLAERGGVQFSVAASADEALDILRVSARQKSRRWLETGGRDYFADPAYRAFNETFTRIGFDLGLVHAACLRVDEAIIATQWGLVFRGRYYVLLMGYERDWARFSPGSLLIEDEIARCIAQPGIEVLDLTVGDESYKRRWADEALAMYDCVEARSLKGKAFLGAYRGREALKRIGWLREAVRWAKTRLPR